MVSLGGERRVVIRGSKLFVLLVEKMGKRLQGEERKEEEAEEE